jgi:hypothetical protein
MKSDNQTSSDIVRRNEAQWYVRLLRKDIEELRREQAHLRSKISERSLTDWESQRIREITVEIVDLLTKFTKISQPQLAK